MYQKYLYLIFLLEVTPQNTSSSTTTSFMSRTAEIPDQMSLIDVYDLSTTTTWKHLSEYYVARERQWKVCVNCGVPGLGTSMHMELSEIDGSMHPAVVPPEYLFTRLIVIDVSFMTLENPALILTLDIAQEFDDLKRDPPEPTMLLFKFGWKPKYTNFKNRNCVCAIPGLSYELAEWIAANMSHVVGVGTDVPTLESDQTRDFTTRTVTNVLGKNGIYMIEYANLQRSIPERGCLAVAMPLKMSKAKLVPTRLTALCPWQNNGQSVVMGLRKITSDHKYVARRVYDVNLDEIMH